MIAVGCGSDGTYREAVDTNQVGAEDIASAADAVISDASSGQEDLVASEDLTTPEDQDALSTDAEVSDVMSSDSAEDAIALEDTRTPLDINGDVAIEPTDIGGEDDAAVAVDGGSIVEPQDSSSTGDIWMPGEDTFTTSPDALEMLDVGESLDAVPPLDTEGTTDVGTPPFDTVSSLDIGQLADTSLEPADAGTPSSQNDVGESVADIGWPEDTDEPPKDVTQPPDAQLKPGDVTSGKDSIDTMEADVVSESDTGPGWSISDAMPGKPDLVPQENEPSCSADCAGKICGSDGCGGSCGSCSGFKVCTDFGAACAAPEGEQSYRVGVDYHATGADFDTAFLSRYHEPGVRDDVLAQLQGMANEGVKIISTRMWLTNAPGVATPAQPYRWEFPPSDQQVDNLNQFVNDVAGVVSTGGQYLDVHLGFLHLWCARYRTGSPTTTLGECGLTAEEYTASMLESFERVIDAVAGIYRPDGQHAVSLFYMDGEILAAADDNDPAVVNEKKNIRWFLQTHYPAFNQKARAAGIIPSVYFLVNPSESHALQNDYSDSYFPILHQRRSMYWLYRSVKFMKDANLEVPARIDFSMYTYYPYDFSNPATIVNRIFDDLEATLGPLLGTPLRYAIAETPYYEDVTKRRRMAKAIAAERDLRGSNPEFVTFWTTPYGNGLTPPVGYPFDIDVWYGDDLIAPFGGLNPSFEVAAT
ncbi:MAG: hypothetical protein VX223_00005, partial [Myxococcota bacterium]|nr:hypothetical protein [Myxococcota bacterium]